MCGGGQSDCRLQIGDCRLGIDSAVWLVVRGAKCGVRSGMLCWVWSGVGGRDRYRRSVVRPGVLAHGLGRASFVVRIWCGGVAGSPGLVQFRQCRLLWAPPGAPTSAVKPISWVWPGPFHIVAGRLTGARWALPARCRIHSRGLSVPMHNCETAGLSSTNWSGRSGNDSLPVPDPLARNVIAGASTNIWQDAGKHPRHCRLASRPHSRSISATC